MVGIQTEQGQISVWMRILDRFVVPVLFGFSFLICLVLYAVQPLEHGHSYHLGVKVTAILAGIYVFYRYAWRWIETKRWVLLLPLILGLGLAVHRLATINPDAEIIHTYQSLFEAIEQGQNPYTCACIFHRAEFNEVKFGNFNYPVMEIWPYWLAYKIFGVWNSAVLTGTLFFLQILVCLVLLRTFPCLRFVQIAAFFPIFLFYEIYTNVATSFLVVSLIVYVIKAMSDHRQAWHPWVLAVLFALGLHTKFIIMPLLAAYYWNRTTLSDFRSLARSAMELMAVLVVAGLLALPYGLKPVLDNTLLFNLILDDREMLTTFYPNVFSGLFSWIGYKTVYPEVAVAVLVAGIMLTKKLSLFSALLASCIVFMMVIPTPEPQYIPVILYVAVAGRMALLEKWKVKAPVTG